MLPPHNITLHCIRSMNSKMFMIIKTQLGIFGNMLSLQYILNQLDMDFQFVNQRLLHNSSWLSNHQLVLLIPLLGSTFQLSIRCNLILK